MRKGAEPLPEKHVFDSVRSNLLGKRKEEHMIQKIKGYIKKEPVLCIALLLAFVSMFWIHPDAGYVDYIDFRTLAILFCLMAVVAGMKEIGVFDWFSQKLLLHVKGMWQRIYRWRQQVKI